VPPDNALSPARFGALIVEAYTSPRQSMARILAMQPDERARLLMVVMGTVISMVGFVALGEREEAVGPGVVLFGYIVTILGALVQYFVASWVLGTVCRAFGGEGTHEQDRTMVAWLSLVTSPVSAVLLLGLRGGGSPLVVVMVLVVTIVLFAVLSAFIAEVHRFRSTGRVAGATLALLLILSLVLSSLLPMPV